MKIWFRNIISAKLKYKKCTRRIKHDLFFLYYSWLKLDISFSTSLAWLIFLVVFFFANYCHLLSFLKKSQNCSVTNFCIVSNLFLHEYNDKNFSKGNKKQVSLWNQCHCETRKPVFLWNQFPCDASFPGTPVSPRHQFPCDTSFPATPVSPRNQYWIQKFFKFLM